MESDPRRIQPSSWALFRTLIVFLIREKGPWKLFVGAAVNQAIAMQCGLNQPHYSKEQGLLALEGGSQVLSSRISCSLFSFWHKHYLLRVVELLCVYHGFSSHEVLRKEN